MLFHSPTFLVFLAAFLAGLYFFRGEARIVYVCLASYLFYGWWYPPYLAILIGLTVYAHLFASWRPLLALHLGVVAAIGLMPLAVFKYTGFISRNLALVVGPEAAFEAGWKLPLGISFITFTAIAYVVDSRKGVVSAEPRFWHTALFISFFPQLIAGPILRAWELMPQIKGIRIDRQTLRVALLLFTIGAFKKVGVADQIAPTIDAIYDGLGVVTGPQAGLAFYGFLVQIYCDFSGYTDMALGLGLLLNVQLPANFDRPYIAASVREFWRCWHMTLSRWLRDYLYFSLGGSRHGLSRTVLAIVLTMVLGGLWHGAAWTFVVWGALHGTLVVIEHLSAHFGLTLSALPRWFKRLLVLHFVGFAWIFFRAPDFERAADVIGGFARAGDPGVLVAAPLVPILIALVLLLHPFDNLKTVRSLAERMPFAIVVPMSTMLILIFAALSINNPSAFIYFDF